MYKLIEKLEGTEKEEPLKGLGLIYSEFKRLQGIDIIEAVLEEHGYYRLKFKKVRSLAWSVKVAPANRLLRA